MKKLIYKDLTPKKEQPLSIYKMQIMNQINELTKAMDSFLEKGNFRNLFITYDLYITILYKFSKTEKVNNNKNKTFKFNLAQEE